MACPAQCAGRRSARTASLREHGSTQSQCPYDARPAATIGTTRESPTAAILSPPMIRVANAPCSWGILEFAGGAQPAGYATVLDEIRATGYAGTELGDWGFMPTDPRRLDARACGAAAPIGRARSCRSRSRTNPRTHAGPANSRQDRGVDARRRRGRCVHRPVRQQRCGPRARAAGGTHPRGTPLVGRSLDHIRRRRRSGRARGAGARPACTPCFIRIAAATSKRPTRSTS